MNKTGIFVTEEEKKECAQLAEEAGNTPLIGLSSEHALRGGMAQDAWQMAYDKVNSLAKKYGLPEVKGNYGMSLKGEILLPWR